MAGSHWFEQNVLQKLRDVFCVGKESCESFKYIGLNLSQDGETIVLSQNDYANSMNTVPVQKERVKTSQLTSAEQTALRSKIGQLLWLIAFNVASVSATVTKSTVEDLRKVTKLI